MVFVLIAGLMNLAVGISGFYIYYSLDIPNQTRQLQSLIDSATSLPQELISTTDTSVNNINGLLDVTTVELANISDNFYKEAQFFWDWNVIGYHPETTTNIGNSFYQLHQSVDNITPPLRTISGNVTQISSVIKTLANQLDGLKASSGAIKQSAQMITPIILFICAFFVFQGLALISIGVALRHSN